MEQFDYSVGKDDWINTKDVFFSKPQQRQPSIDKAVSAIVGKEIRTNDPRLISLVVKWKKQKGDDESQDNFLENPGFIKELKEKFI